jgi:hypothetical protein
MRSIRLSFGWVLVILFAVSGGNAMAYIGPGVGAGLIATVLGLLAAFVLALFGIVYYPIKRFLRDWKVRRGRTGAGNESGR